MTSPCCAAGCPADRAPGLDRRQLRLGQDHARAALAARIGAAYVELDSIFHQPGWTALPRDDCGHRVAALTAGDSWVIDGNRERWRAMVSRDPRENIVLWSWTQHGRYAAAPTW